MSLEPRRGGRIALSVHDVSGALLGMALLDVVCARELFRNGMRLTGIAERCDDTAAMLEATLDADNRGAVRKDRPTR